MTTLLISILVLWMLAGVYCGARGAWRGFAVVLLGGLAANTAWLVIGLDASPANAAFVIAQLAATLYAFASFGTGWLMARLGRQMRARKAG